MGGVGDIKNVESIFVSLYMAGIDFVVILVKFFYRRMAFKHAYTTYKSMKLPDFRQNSRT